MELALDLDVYSEELNIEEEVEVSYEIPTEWTLIPKDKVVLGLDISESSSGICLYDKGEKLLANISLETGDVDFQEVLLRRELKKYLTEVVEGKDFDLVIIEDAFQGVNPTVTRKLYAINTAIDELILDGVCTCKDFRRVNNQLWKSWLFTIDNEGLYKGIEDKLKIQKCMAMLGVTDSGEGFQDRLDANGMILGYYLCKSSADEAQRKSKIKRVSIGDIECDYQEDQELVLYNAGYGIRDIKKMYISERYLSKKLIIDYLSDNPDIVFITDRKLSLGILGDSFNLPIIEGGGYVAFWVKPEKVSKYLKEEK